jgi:hypothetical protein
VMTTASPPTEFPLIVLWVGDVENRSASPPCLTSPPPPPLLPPSMLLLALLTPLSPSAASGSVVDGTDVGGSSPRGGRRGLGGGEPGVPVTARGSVRKGAPPELEAAVA